LLVLLIAIASARLAAMDDATPLPTMAPDEIPIGATGHWRTCVAGTSVTQFPMRVLGLLHDNIYPGLPIIVCEALDPLNKHSGPVAGMSGSPVFVNECVVGAYAYGPIFQKDQALFLATPIEMMLAVQQVGGVVKTPQHVTAAAFSIETFEMNTAPVCVRGMSIGATRWLQDQLAPYGVNVLAGGLGGIVTNISTRMTPGSPLAAVILYGDIAAAAIGTLTYRDGSNIVAFGHPFFRCGAIEMPMAAADIVTVSHQTDRSYKIGNIGPIVGSIYQDRAPAVAGILGRFARTIPLDITIRHPVFGTNSLCSQAIRHETFTGMALNSAIMSVLASGIEAAGGRTLRTTLDVTLNTGQRLVSTNIVAGWNSDMIAGNAMTRIAGAVLASPLAATQLDAVRVTIDVLDDICDTQITRAWLACNDVKPGDAIDVVVELQPYRAARQQCTMQVRVPADMRAGTYTVHICDGVTADALDGLDKIVPASLSELTRALARPRPRDRIYLLVRGAASGLVMDGDVFAALPPSALARWRSNAVGPLTQRTFVETTVAMNAAVHGNISLTLIVK
jgi:hypothetical protein